MPAPDHPTADGPAPPAAPPPDDVDDAADDHPRFDPVALRARYDGWLPDKQEAFIRALAATACVEEACRLVKMAPASAYRLRARPDAQSFRLAWEAALDLGIARLSDAALSRAIHGVPVPHFYKGEQVGQHRRFDERLTLWLLRYRDPVRYGKWRDRVETRQHGDGPAAILMHRINELIDDCFGFLKRRLPIGPRYGDEEEDRG